MLAVEGGQLALIHNGTLPARLTLTPLGLETIPVISREVPSGRCSSVMLVTLYHILFKVTYACSAGHGRQMGDQRHLGMGHQKLMGIKGQLRLAKGFC